MPKLQMLAPTAFLSLVWFASPCVAQVGVPTPQDILENNLNALRGGAQPRVGPPTQQQQLDRNIDSLRTPSPMKAVAMRSSSSSVSTSAFGRKVMCSAMQ